MFGAPAQSPSPFGGGFGAASTPAFGASPAPAFGATNSAFGAPASSAPFSFSNAPTSGFGAASSASAFGQASAPSLFGGASTSAFGAPSSTPSMFGGTSSPSLFGQQSAPAAANTSAFSFGGSAPGQTNSLFGQQPAQAGALTLSIPSQQQQQQPLITYSTKYESLPPQLQKELQDIQREISSYREDCEKLDRDQRLHDSAALKRSMEDETSSLKAALQGMLNAIRGDDEQLTDFREKVMQLLRSTESAVRTFQRSKLWRDAPQQYKGQMMPPQVQDLLASPVVLPAPFLEAAIQGFQDTLETYRQVISELESALPSSAFAGGDDASMVQQLPTIVSHMHDFFVHVAARLEQLHNQIERSKAVFLEQRRAAGDMTDPFQASRRHESHAAAGNKLVVMPPAPHHHYHHHGHQHQMHAGTPHGPGASPSPGAFGTPLPDGSQGMTPSPFGGPVNPAAGDMSRKQSSKGRRK